MITPNSQQFVFVNDTLNFSGINSFDPDANFPLSFRWTLTGAATSITESNQAALGVVAFTEAGVVTVRLSVTDNAGLVSEPASVVINVSAQGSNRAPNGHILYTKAPTDIPTETQNLAVVTNTTITFSSSANDPDGDTVTGYEWTIPDNVVTDPVTPGSDPFTVSFSSPGTYNIFLTVVDELGNRDLSPASMSITVTDTQINSAPDGSINHTGNNTGTGNFSITRGVSVTFAGSATDPDTGDTYSSQWI